MGMGSPWAAHSAAHGLPMGSRMGSSMFFLIGDDTKFDTIFSFAVHLGAVALKFRTVLSRTIHKLLHFDWSLSRSADSTANKNDVISDCPT